MKLKTLAWCQIIIGVILFLKVIIVIFSANGASEIGFAFGSTLDIFFIALFAVLTGAYNLDQKK